MAVEASLVMKFLDSDTKAFPYRTGKEHWWGFIDGNLVTPAEDSEITVRLTDFSEGLAVMQFADGSVP
jgi:hypothetical protein